MAEVSIGYDTNQNHTREIEQKNANPLIEDLRLRKSLDDAIARIEAPVKNLDKYLGKRFKKYRVINDVTGRKTSFTLRFLSLSRTMSLTFSAKPDVDLLDLKVVRQLSKIIELKEEHFTWKYDIVVSVGKVVFEPLCPLESFATIEEVGNEVQRIIDTLYNHNKRWRPVDEPHGKW
jgi:hypothetical protein